MEELNKARKTMTDSLTKGTPRSQINPGSIPLYAAIDKIIIKLATLAQPLSIRSDYGTSTADLSERLKEIKSKMKEALDAAMFKQVPLQPMPAIEDYDAPAKTTPQIIVIEDYDDVALPGVVEKKGPPCCPECGQEIPGKRSVDALCMDHKFRTIRDTLRNSDLSDKELKVIHRSLDAIYKKYRELEEDKD